MRFNRLGLQSAVVVLCVGCGDPERHPVLVDASAPKRDSAVTIDDGDDGAVSGSERDAEVTTDAAIEKGASDANFSTSSGADASSASLPDAASERHRSRDASVLVDGATELGDAGRSDSASSDVACDGGDCGSGRGDAGSYDAGNGGSHDAGDGGLTGRSCPPSCISNLFTSCVPSGHDECVSYNYGETACWPNGAYQQIVGSAEGSSATVRHSNGDLCLSIDTIRQPDNSFEVQWLDGQGTLAAEGLQDPYGTFTIQCADDNSSYVVAADADCFPFFLPFLDSVACEYGDGEPPAGTCGH
jgi:hypothetical protein